MEFYPKCDCVNTTVWMHHQKSGKMQEKKKLDGNHARTLEAGSLKTAAIRPLTSHHANNSSKTNKTFGGRLEK